MDPLKFTRREFLKTAAATGVAAAVFSADDSPLKGLAQAAGPAPAADEQIIKTSCWLCHGGCGIITHVKDGRLVKVEGNPDDPYDEGRVCVRPLAGTQYVYSPFRLKYPMKRVGARGEGKWQRISWDEAYDTISKKMLELRAKYGPETLATFNGTGRVASYVYPYLPSVWGTPNDANNYLCYLPRQSIENLMWGYNGIAPIRYLNSKCVVFWGKAPISSSADSSPKPGGQHIADAVEKGTKFIVVDPMYTREASKAALWLPVKPGGDMPLAFAWLNVIIGEKLYDADVVDTWTNAAFLVRTDKQELLKPSDVVKGANARNFCVWDTASNSAKMWDTTQLAYESPAVKPAREGAFKVTLADGTSVDCKTVWTMLWETVKDWTPEKAEVDSWVPADQIRAAARMFASEKPSLIFPGVTVDMAGVNSTSLIQALYILNSINGSVDTFGGFYAIVNDPIRRLATIAPTVAPEIMKKRIGLGEVLVADPSIAYRNNANSPSVHKAVVTGKPYSPHIYYEIGGNELTHSPQTQLAYEAFKQVEFSVAQIIEMGPTVEMCDIALPVPTPFERNEPNVNLRVLEKLAPMPASIPPLWESRPDYVILKDLMEKMGMGGAWTAFKTDLELAKWEMQPLNISWEQYIKDGFQLVPPEYKRYEKGHLRTGRPPFADNKPGFKTPSGRMELWVSSFEGRPKNYTHSQLPILQPIPEGYTETPELAKKFPIVLTTGPRELDFPYFHSMLHHVPWLREIQPWPLVRVNPDTAAQNGIHDGDWVWVETQWGKARYKAELYQGIHPKVVAVTHHWHYPEISSTPENPRGVMYSSSSLLTQWYGEGTGREDLYHDIFGNPTTRGGLLCRISKCEEGAPPGSGLDQLAMMYKTGQGITW